MKMKNLILTMTAAVGLITTAHANGWGYDGNGRYYQWNNTPNGGYGYDGNGRYYQWNNTPNGGYGYDGNGRYYQWNNN
jgi:hypothetical protein